MPMNTLNADLMSYAINYSFKLRTFNAKFLIYLIQFSTRKGAANLNKIN